MNAGDGSGTASPPRQRSARPTLNGFAPGSARARDLRIRLRDATVEELVARDPPFINEDRVLVHTRSPLPVGSRLRLLVSLSTGELVLRVRALVCRTQQTPRPGMELAVAPLDEASRQLIERVRARHPPIPPLPLKELVPEENTVPANPLGGISDGAIEDFVHVSLLDVTDTQR